MRSVKSLLLVGLLVALALGLTQALPGKTPTAAAATVVACGTSSSADGEQMILTANLACAGTAVTITHNKVHFDLQGFTISGPGSSPSGPCPFAIGVNVVGASRVHINGGTITNFFDGIRLSGTHDSHVNGMTLTANCAFGVSVFDHSGRNRFNSNFIDDNVGGPSCGGVRVDGGSHDNDFKGNSISRNGDVGIALVNSSGNKLIGNTVNDSRFFGIPTTNIALIGNSDNNVVRGNTTNGPLSEDGINVGCEGGCPFISAETGGADGNVIQGNTADNNIRFGIAQSNANQAAGTNTYKGNSATGNGTDFFQVP